MKTKIAIAELCFADIWRPDNTHTLDEFIVFIETNMATPAWRRVKLKKGYAMGPPQLLITSHPKGVMLEWRRAILADYTDALKYYSQTPIRAGLEDLGHRWAAL